jgi:hypothetical protein
MATCDDCKQEMRFARSCSLPAINIQGISHLRVRFGSERPKFRSQRCGDCNVARGGLHHLGCDIERCPLCGGQLISCACLDGEELEEETVTPAANLRQ